MSYLERNSNVFTELNEKYQNGTLIPHLRLCEPIETKFGTIFTPLGHYFSEVLGKKVFLGLKENEEMPSDSELKIILTRQLETIKYLETYEPDIVDELPIIHGILIIQPWQLGIQLRKGILTEDYSEGGKYKVYFGDNALNHGMKFPDLSRNSNDLTITNDSLSKLFFFVNGVRKIGNLASIRPFLDEKISDKIKPLEYCVEKQFTLRLN